MSVCLRPWAPPAWNRVRTAAVYGDDFDLACRLGRSAEVDIEMMPHPYDPKVLAVRLREPEPEAVLRHGPQWDRQPEHIKDVFRRKAKAGAAE